MSSTHSLGLCNVVFELVLNRICAFYIAFIHALLVPQPHNIGMGDAPYCGLVLVSTFTRAVNNLYLMRFDLCCTTELLEMRLSLSLTTIIERETYCQTPGHPQQGSPQEKFKAEQAGLAWADFVTTFIILVTTSKNNHGYWRYGGPSLCWMGLGRTLLRGGKVIDDSWVLVFLVSASSWSPVVFSKKLLTGKVRLYKVSCLSLAIANQIATLQFLSYSGISMCNRGVHDQIHNTAVKSCASTVKKLSFAGIRVWECDSR